MNNSENLLFPQTKIYSNEKNLSFLVALHCGLTIKLKLISPILTITMLLVFCLCGQIKTSIMTF